MRNELVAHQTPVRVLGDFLLRFEEFVEARVDKAIIKKMSVLFGKRVLPLQLVTILDDIDAEEQFHKVGIVPADVFLKYNAKYILSQFKQLLAAWLDQWVRQ